MMATNMNAIQAAQLNQMNTLQLALEKKINAAEDKAKKRNNKTNLQIQTMASKQDLRHRKMAEQVKTLCRRIDLLEGSETGPDGLTDKQRAYLAKNHMERNFIDEEDPSDGLYQEENDSPSDIDDLEDKMDEDPDSSQESGNETPTEPDKENSNNKRKKAKSVSTTQSNFGKKGKPHTPKLPKTQNKPFASYHRSLKLDLQISAQQLAIHCYETIIEETCAWNHLPTQTPNTKKHKHKLTWATNKRNSAVLHLLLLLNPPTSKKPTTKPQEPKLNTTDMLLSLQTTSTRIAERVYQILHQQPVPFSSSHPFLQQDHRLQCFHIRIAPTTNVKLLQLNVRGLRSPEQQFALIAECNLMNYHIAFLSETKAHHNVLRKNLTQHTTSSISNNFTIFGTWDEQVPNGSGCAIALSSKLMCRASPPVQHKGYVIGITIWSSTPTLLLSIYWPQNQQNLYSHQHSRNHSSILHFIESQLREATRKGHNIIAGGDFNQRKHPNDFSNAPLLELLERYALLDVHETLSNKNLDYFNEEDSHSNRIDFTYPSTALIRRTFHTEIETRFSNFTDHP